MSRLTAHSFTGFADIDIHIFPPYFLQKIVVETKASGPPYVLKLVVMLMSCQSSSKQNTFSRTEPLFLQVKFHANHKTVTKLR